MQRLKPSRFFVLRLERRRVTPSIFGREKQSFCYCSEAKKNEGLESVFIGQRSQLCIFSIIIVVVLSRIRKIILLPNVQHTRAYILATVSYTGMTVYIYNISRLYYISLPRLVSLVGASSCFGTGHYWGVVLSWCGAVDCV